MRWPEIRDAARDLLREPVRAAVVLGGAILIVGALLPWIDVETTYRGRLVLNGLSDPGDGAITASGGVLLILLGRSGSFGASRILTVAAAPFVIALACALLSVVAYRSAGEHLDVLRRSGAVGGLSVGLDLTVLGSLVATGGGAVRLWRARRLLSRPTFAPRDIAQLTLGIAGALGGFWLGLAGSLSVLGPNMGALLFAAIFGGFAGGQLGVLVAGRLFRPATRP
jgi:hypothetical protein